MEGTNIPLAQPVRATLEARHGSRAMGRAADEGYQDSAEGKHEARPLTQLWFNTPDPNQDTPTQTEGGGLERAGNRTWPC